MADKLFIVKHLWKNIGWRTFPALTSAFAQTHFMFRETKFGKRPFNPNKREERMYLRKITVGVSLYLYLLHKVGQDRAYDITREIILNSGLYRLNKYQEKMNISPDLKGVPRLKEFLKGMQQKPESKFNEKEIVVDEPNHYHVKITKCIVHELMKEFHLPNLTRMICNVDCVFYPSNFPDVEFTQGETMATGNPYCDFIFKDKTSE